MVTGLRREVDEAEPRQGLTMTALLALPDALRMLLAWMVRQGPVPFREVCDRIGEEDGVCRQLLLALQEKGLVRVVDCGGESVYQVWLVVERGRDTSRRDAWGALSLDL